MKIIYLVLLALASFVIVPENDFHGTYSYRQSFYYESIELKSDGHFLFRSNDEFIRWEVVGNYHILGDSLVLDSYPQREKLIVRESNKGNSKSNMIIVTDKAGEYFHYQLYLILKDGSEMSLKDNWGKVKVKDVNIKGFYIIDSGGVQSPKYFLKGTNTNYFEIQFERRRVFENESWVIKKNEITPRGLNGELQEYRLIK